MKRKILTTALILCGVAVGMAAVIADMNGKFSSTLNAPDGNQYQLTYDFKVNGDKLTGTLDSPGGEVQIDSGKVSGDNLTFSVTVQGMAYPHKGKYYAAGDSISMDVDFGGAKTHETLKRAK
jgi:hypothetical protein